MSIFCPFGLFRHFRPFKGLIIRHSLLLTMRGKMEHQERPYYDKDIYADREQAYIKKILRKYKKEPPTEELKKKIWEELQHEKFLGNISIPFKVILRQDVYNKYPPYIEIILDTKL